MIDTAIVDQLQHDLQALPGLQLREAMPGKGFDLEIAIEVQGRPARILVEIKHRGYPRDLRDALWKLGRVAILAEKSTGEPVVHMVAAPAISHEGRQSLRRWNAAYWDSGGSLHLELPWAIYHIDRPVPSTGKRRMIGLYRGASAQVLHALLMDPGRAWHVDELAHRAEVSAYTAHRVLDHLETMLWVHKQGAGPRAVRLLSQPGALLDAWAKAYSLEQYQLSPFYGWSQSSEALREKVAWALGDSSIDYALTLASGAELVAPYVSSVDRLSVLVPRGVRLGMAIDAAELKPVHEGENVVFMATDGRSPLLFREKKDGVWVASPVQLYLDLYASPRRGKEQANHLRAEKLPY